MIQMWYTRYVAHFYQKYDKKNELNAKNGSIAQLLMKRIKNAHRKEFVQLNVQIIGFLADCK